MNRIPQLIASLGLLVSASAAQWSTPVVEPNVSTASSEFDPCPTLDGLTLYFASSRPPNWEIYRATRTGPYRAFGVPTQITELSSTATDFGPFPRLDDLELFFVSSRSGGLGTNDLWRADRPSTSASFNAPVNVTELNSSGADQGPTMTIDGLRIYFASTRPGGLGGYDIYTATRPNWSSPFGTPTPVTELNTPSSELDAHVSMDGLMISFYSDRPGGLGADDLWVATRLDPASPFGTPVNLTALSSSSAEASPSWSLFADEFFFVSSRPGGPGSYDVYSSRFTGVLGSGLAGIASTQNLRFSDPPSSGRVYLAASSLGSSPGIPIDTRVLPLNGDLLLRLTIGGLPPILTGYVGALDQDGIGSGRISFAGFPQMLGLRFFTAFVVLDPAGPSGIRTISNAHEVLVQ
jgi:hypothetical protein